MLTITPSMQFISLYVIYRNLRTIGRYFFSSTRWIRPIVHIDLYKDEVKKNLESLKKKSR
jgi:hypothetical protein